MKLRLGTSRHKEELGGGRQAGRLTEPDDDRHGGAM